MTPRRRRNVVIPTAFGSLIVSRFDYAPGFAGVGANLLDTGTYAAEEMGLLSQLASRLPAGAVAIDIGANIGVTTLVLAEALMPLSGHVIAFEPQRLIFQMLCGNLALNSIDNVVAHQVAITDRDGRISIPKVDYYHPTSFGSLELGHPQKEEIGQVPVLDGTNEQVPAYRLDSLDLPRLDLMKIDAEGMELAILQGGQAVLLRARPIVLIEWIKSDRSTLNRWFSVAGYRITEAGPNLICIPNESPLQAVSSL